MEPSNYLFDFGGKLPVPGSVRVPKKDQKSKHGMILVSLGGRLVAGTADTIGKAMCGQSSDAFPELDECMRVFRDLVSVGF